MADCKKYGRTANLLDKSTMYIDDCYFTGGNYAKASPQHERAIIYFPIIGGKTYTVKIPNGTPVEINSVCSVNEPEYGVSYRINGETTFITHGNVTQFTRATPPEANWLAVQIENISVLSQNIMANEGTIALPYQPYLDWQHSLRKLTTATEAVENPLYSDGSPITAYTLKGNTVQSGTPSPSNPVMPNGVGERTENLLNADIYYGTYKQADGTYQSTRANLYNVQIKPFTADDIGKTFTFVADISPITGNARLCANINGTIVSGSNTEKSVVTFTVETADDLIFFNYGSGSTTVTTLSDIMLVEGSTAPTSYIPWGYKIPISTLQGSAVNYLSEPLYKAYIYSDILQSDGTITRNIGKVELTGEETVEYISNYGQFKIATSYYRRPPYDEVSFICSHYRAISNADSWSGDNYITISQNDTPDRYYRIKDSRYSTAEDFKTYLAQQYANGTPVTIFYVRPSAATETITAVSIPTTEGANTITVDTTVQPSEFAATWTGWHNAYVKEKSENLANENDLDLQKWISSSGNISDNPQGTIFKEKIAITTTNYTVKATANQGVAAGIGVAIYNSNDEFIRREYSTSLDKTLTFATTTGDNYFKIIVATANTSTESIIQSLSIMANEGSTAQTYAPYWK